MEAEEEFGGFAGFVDEMDAAKETNVKEAVAEAVRRCGLEAYTQDTGGGFQCVVVQHRGLVYWFGTADTTWGADVTEGEESVDSIRLQIPSNSRDAEAIANAIVDALHRRET